MASKPPDSPFDRSDRMYKSYTGFTGFSYHMCKRNSIANSNNADTESIKSEDFTRRSGWSINHSPSPSECGSPSTSKTMRHKKPSFVFPPTYREWYTLLNKLSELEKKIATVEEENVEAKENLEFINSEKTVLAEQVKELEDLLFTEKNQRRNEIDSLEDLASQSKTLFDKVCSKDDKIRDLEEEIKERNKQIESLTLTQEDRDAQLQLLLETWMDFDSKTSTSSSLRLRPKDEDELISAMKKKNNEISEMSKELLFLKDQISNLVSEKASLQQKVRSIGEMEKLRISEQQMREELKEERERVSSLLEEIDGWKEKLRCSDVISQELKRQIKEMTSSLGTSTMTTPTHSSSNSSSPSFMSSSPLALKQELKSVREVIASREEMIQKLNEKYMRHRQVWEENERRANEEIKKLDELIDRVILTLSNSSSVISECPPLKRLLDELTQGQLQDPIISSPTTNNSQQALSSTFV